MASGNSQIFPPDRKETEEQREWNNHIAYYYTHLLDPSPTFAEKCNKLEMHDLAIVSALKSIESGNLEFYLRLATSDMFGVVEHVIRGRPTTILNILGMMTTWLSKKPLTK